MHASCGSDYREYTRLLLGEVDPVGASESAGEEALDDYLSWALDVVEMMERQPCLMDFALTALDEQIEELGTTDVRQTGFGRMLFFYVLVQSTSMRSVVNSYRGKPESGREIEELLLQLAEELEWTADYYGGSDDPNGEDPDFETHALEISRLVAEIRSQIADARSVQPG